jgi:hypothetical protein
VSGIIGLPRGLGKPGSGFRAGRAHNRIGGRKSVNGIRGFFNRLREVAALCAMG